jgi:prepilin-type N-terminal cleavage/methylation domain-containing protein
MFSKVVSRNGFTLVEVIVAILIIAIIATLATIGFTSVQRQSRDAIRKASTVTMAESLEKYYDTHGEYPGCSLLNQNRSSVASLLGVNEDVLTTPNGAAGANSLRCNTDDESSTSIYTYTGDTSSTCTNGTACLYWTIEYAKEVDDSSVSIDSRRRVTVATSGTPVLNGSVESSTEVGLSWTSIANAQQYNVQYSTSNTFSGALSDSTDQISMNITDLSQGRMYYFRVNAVTATGTSPWSNTRTLTLPVDDPDDPAIVASISGTTVTGTAGAVVCAPGTTAQYQLRYRRTASDTDGAWSSYSTWSTGRTYSISNASQGYEYTFQAQARCAGVSATSGVGTSGTDTVIVPIETPGAPALTAALSGSTATGTLAAVTCPSGTSAQYQMRVRTSVDSANYGMWSSYDTWDGTRTRSVTVNPGYRAGFQGQVRCYSAADISDPKASNEASVVRVFAAPTAPSISVALSDSTATATAGAVTCGSGSTAQYQFRTRHGSTSAGSWGSYSSWSTTRTRSDSVSQGYRRGYQVQARCVGDFNASGAAASAEGSTVRGIAAPAAPTWTGDTTWNAGYRYRITYSTSCPSGTSVHSEGVQFYNTGFSGTYRYPSSGYYVAPTDDLWYLGWARTPPQVAEDVYHYARYRCASAYATSGYSANRTTRVDVTCASSRRSYSASPRCDNHGQNWQAMPYGT